MLLIPAIDLKDGRCVRLRQGNLNDATIFSEDPAAMAAHWLEQGARRLHLVDLNGAVNGKPGNSTSIKAILDTVGHKIPVQIGGGIRNLDTIENYLAEGVSHIIIGTAAIQDPVFFKDACARFPGRIMAGLDARHGKIATHGWHTLLEENVLEVAQKLEEAGCAAIIYTDIERDGMLCGLNLEATVQLAQQVSLPIFASGGIADLNDIEALCAAQHTGIRGAILGRSLYENTLNFQLAQKRVDACSPSHE
jgi:phosphoribosylformimino-5-aminoimidazole carboxamide ribotide isomerase